MVMKTLSTSSQSILDRFVMEHPAWQSQSIQLLNAVGQLCKAYHQHALLLTCGNGGSASDASHIVGELVKCFRIPRPLPAADQHAWQQHYGDAGQQIAARLACGLRAVSLSSESVNLTAMGNDVGYDMAFAQQVQALGQNGDILMAMSTSGQSANIITALKTARVKGMSTIGMTGQNTCQMDDVCDLIFHAPATETYRVQEHHLALYHALCMLVENELFCPVN
jgi:phosphoheptose isomerase